MSDPKVGVVVLCRYSSSRLPGKILKEIQGKPLLAYIIERLQTVINSGEFVIATSVEPSDDPIADYCKVQGWACYRGSLENVARRFYEAGKWKGWDYATRINGDNIFVATDVLQKCHQLACSGEFDFISNVHQRTFPKGMSVETVRLTHYQNLLGLITGTSDQEHVTSYLYNHLLPTYQFVYNETCPASAGAQFAIDDIDDFKWAQEVIANASEPIANLRLEQIWALAPRVP